MEEAEREEEEGGEEEEEEESPKELEPVEEEIAIAGAGGLGFFLRYWLWEEEGVFAVKKSRFTSLPQSSALSPSCFRPIN